MKKPLRFPKKLNPNFYVAAGCLALFHPLRAEEPVETKSNPTSETPGPGEAPNPVPVTKSKTPMMDTLLLELMKGEPINDQQAKEVTRKEFGKIWNNLDPYPVDPADSDQVRKTKIQTWIYLAAVKASLLDPEKHGGWATGYGNLEKEGFPRLMLTELKALAAAPLDKANRTIVNYAIITPAWIEDDKETMAKLEKALETDWPGDSFITHKAAILKRRVEYQFPKE